MRFKKLSVTVEMLFFSAYLLMPCGALYPEDSTADIRKSTVKILNTFIKPNYYVPWKMQNPQSSIGSGVIIEHSVILTNAHVVSDSTYLQVQKENDPKLYDADVAFIGHDCDLALIRVRDRRFFEGARPVALGDIPELRSRVTTFGYSEGGARISITEGVVSRIEVGLYSHSGVYEFLKIQTDAAINPGNSGGPVVQNGRMVGIAFQVLASSDNIGYMIPVPIIRHFLDDVKDGGYDGFPFIGVLTSTLQNKSYRDYLGMKETQTGILVTHVVPNGSAWGFIEKGDIIISIDSVPIANDGTVMLPIGRMNYSHISDLKQINEKIALAVLRKNREQKLTFPLKLFPMRIPWNNEYNSLPRYYIFAGIIFQPLSREYLNSWEKWWHNADRRLLYYYQYYLSDALDPDREEFILMNSVLPDHANTYISNVKDAIVTEINGVRIRRLDDVPRAFSNPSGEYHIIKTEKSGAPLILKASETGEAQKRIQQNYRIPSMMRLEKVTY